MNTFRAVLYVLGIFIISACSSPKGKIFSGKYGKATQGGGYYKDDGPGSNIPTNILNTPNATPRVETPRPANLRPYSVMGKTYQPINADKSYRQQGIASWYGRKFHGNKTANGETYDMYAMSAAHTILPLPSYAKVTHAKTGKSVIVRVNDRGPFLHNRIIDLSYAAAAKLDLIGPGSGPVIVEAITNQQIAAQNYAPPKNKDPIIQNTQVAQNNTQTTQNNNQVDQNTPNASSDQAQKKQSTNSIESDELTIIGVQPNSNTKQMFLQYGAFSQPQNAHNLANNINKTIQGLEDRQAKVVINNNLHRVHIGPYKDRTHAVNAALRIKDITGLSASYINLNQ